MLTSLDTHPDATAVDFPPLYDEKPFKIAIEAGHGKYVFSSENEVLYFVDEIMPDGYDPPFLSWYLLTTLLQ